MSPSRPSRKKTTRKVPLPLKRVRKEIPPPSRVLIDRKKYSRKKARAELGRAVEESLALGNPSLAKKKN